MKVILLGYMGSGKSTVGRLLGEQLGIPFLDLDAVIEQQEATTIPQIFSEKGEIHFRKLEHNILLDLLASPDSFILALGGGTPCYSGNMSAILQVTPAVFYLKMNIPSLVIRLIPEKANRPLISHVPDEELPEFIGKHLFERSPFYEQAPFVLNANEKSAAELVKEIQGLV